MAITSSVRIDICGVLLALALLAGACQRSQEPDTVTGTVASVDPVRHAIVLEMVDDEGNALGRRFSVEEVYAQWLEAGMRIRGTPVMLKEEANGEADWALTSIWPAGRNAEQALKRFNRELQQDTIIHGQGAFRAVGERLSAFALWNEKGELVTPEDWRGQRVLINFIFTRCADPTMCPAATRKMRETQIMAEEKGVEDFQLLSITLDPEYDTPAILYDYARAYGIDETNFSFLTGPEEAIEDLFRQLGLLREKDETEIWTHSSATVLLDKDRTVLHRTQSKNWSPEEFIAWMVEEN